MTTGGRSGLGWTWWGLGALLKLAFAGTAVLLPLAGVWIASSLAAHHDGPLWASLVAGALCFPLLPLGWDLFASWRRRRRGETRPRVLTGFDRLVLRTLAINLVFVGGLLAGFPGSVYEALSTRGDWMLQGSDASWATSARSSLFSTAERMRWLHEATHENAYEELIDPSLTKTDTPVQTPQPGRSRRQAPVRTTEKAVSPSDLLSDEGWPFAPTLHPAVSELPAEVETSFDSVARYLADREPDPVQRVKALHDYVADRVAYDAPALAAGHFPPQDAETVFERRTAVCAGYATLLKAMADVAEVEMVVVVGDARDGDGYFDGRGHAWNAVALGGQWYLLDATWDAGHVDGTTFKKSYGAGYFLTPPEVFVATHMPDDPKWQLLAEPLSPGDFLRQPHLQPEFAALDLELVNPRRARHSVRAGESLELRFANPHHFRLSGVVRAEGDPGGLRCETDDERENLTCRFPEAGRRRVSLFGPEGVYLGRLYVDVG